MKQPRFLLITDNTSYRIGGTRYLGPYRVAHELEKSGVETFVIDRFYSWEDFFGVLDDLLDDSFIGIGISTTFFTPPESLEDYNRFSVRAKRGKVYYGHGIINQDDSIRDQWFLK